MYLPYFKFKEKPFSVTSDPAFVYLSQKHREALDHITYGIQNRVGFIEITGEIGTGKTTLCRLLLNQLGPDVKTAFIFNSNLSEMQFMQMFLFDLGLATARKNRHALFSELNRYLIAQLSDHHNVVLIIDEAQNLRVPLLEQIRMLSNLETEKEKLIQIVLVGQPELRAKLNLPHLRQLRQRIAVRYHISPLAGHDVRPYIEHRLHVASENGQIPHFHDAAIEKIHAYSGGVPRLINTVCDKALLLSFVMEKREITSDVIEESIREIEGVDAGAGVAV